MNPRLESLALLETQGGFTHRMRLLPDMLAAGTSEGQALTFNLFASEKGMVIDNVRHLTHIPFVDQSDSAAFDDITVQFGDSGSANRHLTATQIAQESGSLVQVKIGSGAYAYPDDQSTVTVTVTPKAGKKLADVDRGDVSIFFRKVRLPRLAF